MSCFWTNLVGCRQACPSAVGRIVTYSNTPVTTGAPSWLVVGDPSALAYDPDLAEWVGRDVVGALRVTRLIYANSHPGDTFNCGGTPLQLIPGSESVPAWGGDPAGMYQFAVTVDADVEIDADVGWFIDPEGGADNGPDRDELSALLGVTVAEGTVVIFATDDVTGQTYAGGIVFTSCI